MTIIHTYTHKHTTSTTTTTRTSCHSPDCVHIRVQADTWLANPEYPEPATVILEAVVQVLRLHEISKKSTEVLEAAEFVMFTVLCGLGNFPALGAGGAERLSTQVRAKYV